MFFMKAFEEFENFLALLLFEAYAVVFDGQTQVLRFGQVEVGVDAFGIHNFVRYVYFWRLVGFSILQRIRY